MKTSSRLLAILLAIICWSCSPSPKEIVEQASRECPITVNGVGFIRSITLNNAADTLTYHVIVTNPDMADLSSLEGHEDLIKQQLRPGIMGLFDGNKPLREALEKGGWVLQIEYVSRMKGSKPLRVDFSAEQLAAPVPTDTPQARLEREITMGRQFLPADMAPGVQIVDILLDGGMVVYLCAVDEAELGNTAIDGIRVNSSTMKAEMLREMRAATDPDVATMVKVVTEAGYGIAYRYVGTLSGASETLTFPHSALK